MANRVANSLHSREPNGSLPKAVSARNMAASAASAHYHCYHHTSRLRLRLEQQKAARPTGYARNAALASECGNAMRSATQAPSLHAPCRHACLRSSYFAHPTCSEAATAYNASSLHSADGTDVIHAPMHLHHCMGAHGIAKSHDAHCQPYDSVLPLAMMRGSHATTHVASLQVSVHSTNGLAQAMTCARPVGYSAR